jgi:hypothetical protein
MRIVLAGLVVGICCGGTAHAQQFVYPQGFSLIRPQQLSPAPEVMAPMPRQAIGQQASMMMANNPPPLMYQTMLPQAMAPQAEPYQNMTFGLPTYQPESRMPGQRSGSMERPRAADRRPILGW